MSISDLCTNYIKKRGDAIGFEKDALEFIEAPWGLGLGSAPGVPPLHPVQRIQIKAYYGLELDNGSNRNVIVRDQFNEQERYRFNEAEYVKFLYNEGRCNRSEITHDFPNLLLVAGRRGGKCITGDSLVPTDNGIFRIEDLGEAPEEYFSDINVGVVQECGRRSRALAFYNGGVKNTFEVVTASGYTIVGTANHRVKVMDISGDIVWRYLDDIKAGDQVAINRTTDLWAPEMLDLRPYYNGEGRKGINLPDILDERVGKFIGYLVGDGSWNPKDQVSVTVEHSETWDYLRGLYKDVLGEEPKTTPDKRTENTGRLAFFSTGARKFFHDIGWERGVERDQKMIPWSILRSPRNVVCAFLRGLFETDGGIESGGRKITFSSASFRLAHEIQVLLLNLGIVSNVCKKWVKKTEKHYAYLTIKGVRSRKRFAELIGFDSEKKRVPMMEALDHAQEGKSNTEAVPHQKNKLRDLVNSIPVRRKGEGSGREAFRKAIGNAIKNSGEELSYQGMGKGIEIAKELGAGIEELKHFEDLMRMDYFYDPVVSVREREDQVYDLTVPDGVSFVANGMVNHNTTVTSSIIAYEIYKLLSKHSPQEYFNIQPNSQIKLTCVSTSKQTASELFNMVIGSIDQCEWFRRYRQEPTKEVLALQTEKDIELHGHSKHARASLLLRVAACSAKGLRGPSNMVIGLDEMAHFFEDEKNQGGAVGSDKNDRAIYNAITPSVANFKHPDGEPAGKIICLSSPATKSGKFYEEYERSFHPDVDDLLMMQIPTWEMNPEVPSKFLKQRYTENSIVYNVEYGAIFDDRMKGWIEDPEIVRQCVVPGMKYKFRSSVRVPHFMGVDVGLKEDGTSLCVCHHIEERVHGAVENFIEIDASEVRFAAEEGKKHFVPKDVADWIIEYNDRFFIVKGLMDQYYGMGIIPLLEQEGLKQFEYRIFSEQLNSTIYQNLLTQLISQVLRLPEGEKRKVGDTIEIDSDLVAEILTLQAYHKSKYIIRVEAPDREGCHDDLSDALARAVLLATEYKVKGYGSLALSGASTAAKSFRMSRAKEAMKMSLNRPTRGAMTGRDSFSMSVRGGGMGRGMRLR